jgi:hypothetical protein
LNFNEILVRQNVDYDNLAASFIAQKPPMRGDHSSDERDFEEATGGNIPPQQRKSCEKICNDTV